ncbi:hypothetical protein BTA51_13825 [Hahella sp. CCB-MM4]|uniref:hypothetical protein n=1 Tax=Hahella sp. (strain CCB-MM4) TaxID=1926491 RepID=UPI000B9AFB5C|nr:hypothetical protein [Hahella sp. CCB-MM4]OZG73027.1 hypothetical protein BTA51_13825 [Hahella sp. CCB-MM4]
MCVSQVYLPSREHHKEQEIKRDQNGAIDVDFYAQKARKLRADAFMQLLEKTLLQKTELRKTKEQKKDQADCA